MSLALCQSPIERALYIAMIAADLDPKPQIKIGRYTVDFLLGDLVVECDGAAFHSSFMQRRHDELRDEALRAAGYRVLRISGSDIHRDASGCADRVAKQVRWGIPPALVPPPVTEPCRWPSCPLSGLGGWCDEHRAIAHRQIVDW